MLNCKALLCAAAVVLATAPSAETAEPKIYPGAKVEEIEAKPGMGMPPGTIIRFYTSDAPFAQVVAFYKALYKEITMPMAPIALPRGEKVLWAFFTLDGEADLAKSGHWMKIQRPAIMDAQMVDGVMKFVDVRDVTLIQFIKSK